MSVGVRGGEMREGRGKYMRGGEMRRDDGR